MLFVSFLKSTIIFFTTLGLISLEPIAFNNDGCLESIKVEGFFGEETSTMSFNICLDKSVYEVKKKL